MNGHHFEPIIQIAAKSLRLDRRFQIAVGCGDQPDVDRKGLIVTNPCNSSLFQHTQQLRLNRQWHVADFIQKQCPAVGILKRANSIVQGIRIGAFDVPKQRGLDQILGQPSTVQRMKSLALAKAILVECLSDQFLTRTVLAGDQHGGIRRGNSLQTVKDGGHFLT